MRDRTAKRYGWVAVWVVVCALAVYATRWFHGAPPTTGFGAGIGQCGAAYGYSWVVTNNPVLVSPQTRSYNAKGWSIIVGFDEQGRAEQFVYSIASFSSLVGKPPEPSETARQDLLEKFRGGSHWLPQSNPDSGPIWQRADGGAYASYITSEHEMVLMNEQGMVRHIRRLNEGISLGPRPTP